MSHPNIENASRRNFLQGVSGLTLGFYLPAMAAPAGPAAAAADGGGAGH